MKTKLLSQALERIESWPADAQDQLAEIALDIDAGLKDVVYEPTEAEIEGIDRGLRDAIEGRFATDAEVEATFAKFRRGHAAPLERRPLVPAKARTRCL